jgi:hypothetical protein
VRVAGVPINRIIVRTIARIIVPIISRVVATSWSTVISPVDAPEKAFGQT